MKLETNNETPIPPEGFISKEELAARLKKTIRTISNWQRRGIIPRVKCGRSVYYNWADVQMHLQTHCRTCPVKKSTK